MTDPSAPDPSPAASTGPSTRPTSVPDLPLILEQLQDQLDHLRSSIEAQQAVIETYEARLTLLERR